MVQVRTSHPLHDGSVDIDAWVVGVGVDDGDAAVLKRACELSAQAEERARRSENQWADVSCLRAGMEMAGILHDLNLDIESLLAAVVYRAVRERKLPLREVRDAFGDEVANLVNGVLQMAAIGRAIDRSGDTVLGQRERQVDNIRRMLVTLVDDVRVALIKLAERTCAIRAVRNNPDKQQPVAREVFEIYAPLAHRLGIGHIKWELEDLAFRYLQPDAYKRIATLLDERRLARQEYIERVTTLLHEQLGHAGIAAEIHGRVKHIYSIWRKMQRKGISFSEVYDIRAVRILVERVQDCYAALGIVHTLWRNIAGEFDDYIANPKENGYQSLHTAVIGPEGKVLEVQIRTRRMHEEAEFGVCAHWLYKGSDRQDGGPSGYEQKIAWLRQVLEWHEEIGDGSDFASQLSTEVTQDRVYVFTPEGHVVDLPQGATPVDFAYHIHTEVGHCCRGAKVNGRIVPLTYRLHTGERVEILTGSDAHPSRDWLRYDLGYICSSRTRSKIQHWFRQQDREQNLEVGRMLVEREFRRLALTSVDVKEVANRVHCKTVEDMYVAVGAGDINAAQVLGAAQRLVEPARTRQLDLEIVREPRSDAGAGGIRVEGVGNLLTAVAGCCNPVPGDEIAGYVTHGRGVTIHRQDCANLLALRRSEPERLISVSWSERTDQVWPVAVLVEAWDRQGLLSDITTLLSAEKVNVVSLQTGTDRERHVATMRMVIEVSSLQRLSRVLARLGQLPNIVRAERIGDE